MVLNEFGTATIGSRDNKPLVFQYHVKIKILNSKGFGHGDILIRLHKQEGREETVEDLEGLTFSTDESGIVRSFPLENTSIYHINKSQYTN